jgi:hypothetical protein
MQVLGVFGAFSPVHGELLILFGILDILGSVELLDRATSTIFIIVA